MYEGKSNLIKTLSNFILSIYKEFYTELCTLDNTIKYKEKLKYLTPPDATEL